MNGRESDHFYDSADGLRLFCRVYGAQRPGGLPVLCLPGLTRNSRDFVALATRLCAQHEVLAADLRGRGRSAWGPDPSHYQLPTYIQDAWSLMDSRRLSRALIIGTSLGALMGLGMAAMKPDRVAGVVLNDAGPEIDPAGVRRIAGYAGKLPPVTSWTEAAAQAKSIYGFALPGLTDEEWFDYACQGYRENADGLMKGWPNHSMSSSKIEVTRPVARRFAIFCASICRIANRSATQRVPVSPICPTFTIIMNGNCPSA
jgi:pimeloyl-ACP methyl ester carboxylesterase